MRLRHAILLSLVVHLLTFAPARFGTNISKPRAQPTITVSIEPIPTPEPELQDSATKTASSDSPAKAAADGMGKLQQQAQRALSRQLLYPAEAIERGLEGDVTLLLILDRDGRVKSAEIARSSGHAVLDAAALGAARRLGRLPGNSRESLVPISFRLD